MRHSTRRPSSYGSTSSSEDLGDDVQNTLEEPLIDDLDEEWDFQPQPGDSVWVKSKGEDETWYLGVVMKGSTRTGPVRQGLLGTFWPVKYRQNLRRHFAPLLGELKPDTPHVRQLLKDTGANVFDVVL